MIYEWAIGILEYQMEKMAIATEDRDFDDCEAEVYNDYLLAVQLLKKNQN